MTTTGSPATVRARPDAWWEGVGSPGLGGYVLADVVSVLALATLIVLTSTLTAPGVASLAEVAGISVMVVGFGLVISIPFAVVGCTLVHLACLRVRSQAVHVLAAGVAGLVALPLAGLVLGGEVAWESVYTGLGVATATGRLAVVPLARRRMGRRTGRSVA